MKTLNDLFVDYAEALEDDPFNTIGKIRHAIVRQLRWDAIIIKLKITFAKANLDINEEKGFVKFNTKKYGRITYFPKADKLQISKENVWIDRAQNWLNNKVPDIIPKQQHFEVDEYFEEWVLENKKSHLQRD